MLFVGSLLQWSDTDEKIRQDRIIWREPCGNQVATIDIEDPLALPVLHTYVELERAVLENNALLLSEDEDPYLHLCTVSEASLSGPQKECREKRWRVVSWLLDACGQELFFPEKRHRAIHRAIGEAVQKIAGLADLADRLQELGQEATNSEVQRLLETHDKLLTKDELAALSTCLREDGQGAVYKALQKLVEAYQELLKSIRSIYKFLRWYWQRGLAKNALLPSFADCGAKGKTKPPSEKKRGRLSVVTCDRDEPWGINIDDQMAFSLARLYRVLFVQGQGRPLSKAYQLALEALSFGTEQSNGLQVPQVLPAGQRPSLEQFRYWGERYTDLMDRLRSRVGKHRFETEHRAKEGNAREVAFGPGSLIEGDAGYGQICLVSALDPSRQIGQPIIYLLVDVFSTLVMGMSVSLEGPNWIGYMLALEQMATDKVAYCKEYGIDITPEQWPCHHLPTYIRGDRGNEFIGRNSDNLNTKLGIELENTPPYRPDLKPIIEALLGRLKAELIHELPGNTWHPRKRGDPDPHEDASLNLYRFRRVAIKQVIYHNIYHRLENYPLTPAMIADHVDPYPIDLWNWGLLNRAGFLRKKPQKVVRASLLPDDKAEVTRHGIRYRSLCYTCKTAEQEQWSAKARNYGSWPVGIVFDPRKTDEIYLRHETGEIEHCWLIGKSARFKGYDWADILDNDVAQAVRTRLSATRDSQAEAELDAFVRQEVEAAKAEKAAATAGKSKAETTSGIRLTRKGERDAERQEKAWTFPDQPQSTPPSPAPSSDPVVANSLKALHQRNTSKKE